MGKSICNTYTAKTEHIIISTYNGFTTRKEMQKKLCIAIYRKGKAEVSEMKGCQLPWYHSFTYPKSSLCFR